MSTNSPPSIPPPGSPQEKAAESIPTREEILLKIGNYCEHPVVKRELSDERGVYLLEVQQNGKMAGETVEYIYQRKGVFPNKIESLATIIHVVYSTEGIPEGGHDVSQYDPETKQWNR